MKNKTSIALLIVIMLCLVSCIFNKAHKDVDPFYTTNHFGQFHILPLLKPLTLMYDPSTKVWWLEDNHSLKHNISINTLTEIGVDKTYIYGNILGWKDTIQSYTAKDYVFTDKYGITSWNAKKDKPTPDEIQIYPTDSIQKIFIIPERWFVINVADSTTEAFFSKKEYKNYLKEKGVSGKMYNIESLKKEFAKTGIAPWFPEDVKTKLRE
ncbi:hypothetical protein OIU80_13520 [Flavobacterium sp. LS1R47]|jgi:hypothetical protein|uniref:Uncharacterized protein n=1 Tax=Flavobacterium frigoritolerans TaxID=2987686 RepID=A0A9X2Z136_9FLAO|nr:hypothetical protein [Flavobacterium frigoritolerans]MCV9933304.1 hypothetical protein [Flavobacterium frigoritolerans]